MRVRHRHGQRGPRRAAAIHARVRSRDADVFSSLVFLYGQRIDVLAIRLSGQAALSCEVVDIDRVGEQTAGAAIHAALAGFEIRIARGTEVQLPALFQLRRLRFHDAARQLRIRIRPRVADAATPDRHDVRHRNMVVARRRRRTRRITVIRDAHTFDAPQLFDVAARAGHRRRIALALEDPDLQIESRAAALQLARIRERPARVAARFERNPNRARLPPLA